MLAIIGGSILATLPEVAINRKQIVRTPYGLPNAPLYFVTLGRHEVVLLARHGSKHTWAPHEIHYRANIWALQHAGVEAVIAISAVSGLSADYAPGTLAVPHDIIDYTYGREHTFYEGQHHEVHYTDFSRPYCAEWRERVIHAAAQIHIPLTAQAVYACVQGPRLPTAAEAQRYQYDGADIVGMTGMPEAVLARELGLRYIHLCGIVGHAANVDNTSDQPVERQHHSTQAMNNISRLLHSLGETA